MFVATLRRLCSHIYLTLKVQGGAEGGGGEVAGLSTLFADRTIVIPSAGVFSHLTDFVAKANTAVHSMYISQCQRSKFNIT